MRVREQLEKKGFVSVVYPDDLAHIVRQAMSSWQSFCKMPADVKRMLSGGDRHHDFGYMVRDDSGPTADHKEQFHLNQEDLPLLFAEAESLPFSATEFIRCCDKLLAGIQDLILDCAEELEAAYRLEGLREAVFTAVPRWTFRFLCYPCGQMLAQPHTDRGGLTLHLSETVGGGEYLSPDDGWLPWPLPSGQTIIFPGMLLQHKSHCEIKALCHRVVGRELLPQTPRYAMVAFIDLDYPRRYNNVDYRTQDLIPGSTYSMVFEEFDKLFLSSK